MRFGETPPIRRKHGLLPDTEVEVVEKDGQVVVQLKEGGMNRGRWITDQLRGRLKGKTRMTTEKFMALTRGRMTIQGSWAGEPFTAVGRIWLTECYH